jgi:hypothetical protein
MCLNLRFHGTALNLTLRLRIYNTALDLTLLVYVLHCLVSAIL